MKVKINISLVVDLDEIKEKFISNPCQRLQDIIKLDCGVEKVTDDNSCVRSD